MSQEAVCEKSTATHFSVDMATVVSLARDMVLSNNWRGAIRVLQHGTVPQMPLDLVVDILSGKSTLQGDESGAEAVTQDPNNSELQRYLKTAEWQTAGLYACDGEFYQPYAVIPAFDSQDEAAAMKQIRDWEDIFSMEQYREARARYHMERKESDIVRFDIAKKPVLFKRVQGPAFWVKTFDDAAEAWADFLAKRGGNLQSSLDQKSRPECSHTSWEFYFKAAVEGLIYEGRYDAWKGMPKDEVACLEEVFRLQNEYEDARCQLDVDDLDCDEEGYVVNDAYLKDQMREQAYNLMYRYRIHLQAERTGGFMSLQVQDVDESYELMVPRAPFLYWACHHSFGYKKGTLPDWTPVCPSGMKMMGDNPMHTDWWVGAGLPPRAAYNHDHPVNKAAWRVAYNLAHEEGYDCVKLAGSGKVTGPIVFPQPNEAVPAGSIAVVPNAGVDYELALLSACKDGAGAVIAEVGGKLAHLAIISREFNARLLVVDDARNKFKDGEMVTIDMDKGTISALGRKDLF